MRHSRQDCSVRSTLLTERPAGSTSSDEHRTEIDKDANCWPAFDRVKAAATVPLHQGSDTTRTARRSTLKRPPSLLLLVLWRRCRADTVHIRSLCLEPQINVSVDACSSGLAGTPFMGSHCKQDMINQTNRLVVPNTKQNLHTRLPQDDARERYHHTISYGILWLFVFSILGLIIRPAFYSCHHQSSHSTSSARPPSHHRFPQSHPHPNHPHSRPNCPALL